MINSLTYLTRRCPRKCGYCRLRDAKNVGPELLRTEWQRAFDILHELGINFNLILGNETWLLGEALLNILRTNKVPYALYTTCPEPIFSYYNRRFYESGALDNLSCGIDFPPLKVPVNDDSYRKSMDALKGFAWVKENFPNVDTHGTITVTRYNVKFIPKLLSLLSKMGVFTAINFVHWDKDGGFDFFPSYKEIRDLLKFDEDELQDVIGQILEKPGLLQNPDYLKLPIPVLAHMGWHCEGNPYGGPSIDSDGKLRVCGYRRGKFTPELSIFDLPKKLDEWKDRVSRDAMDCPGCAWSYAWQYHYWIDSGQADMGVNVFVKHAGKHIPKDKWSKRTIE
jgi:MoaA/NifB/PqqE/SkfB family radical SAM enzyme